MATDSLGDSVPQPNTDSDKIPAKEPPRQRQRKIMYGDPFTESSPGQAGGTHRQLMPESSSGQRIGYGFLSVCPEEGATQESLSIPVLPPQTLIPMLLPGNLFSTIQPRFP